VADQPENTQFEQVLSRLDALMKRGQPTEPAALPEPLPATTKPLGEEASGMEALSSDESATPFVILEEAIEIPVLTEVYEGTLPDAPSQGSEDELADAVIDALMPLMLENLDLIVAEEAAKMQQHIAERLRIEIAEALRARLRQQN
jgi:hypothetical protein